MELFATDRDRPAFLRETDAAMDLDFEVPNAQGEAAAKETSPEERHHQRYRLEAEAGRLDMETHAGDEGLGCRDGAQDARCSVSPKPPASGWLEHDGV